MDCEVREESIGLLPQYEQIPIAFDVHSILEVQAVDRGLSGIVFAERKLQQPFAKDYDALEQCRPTSWPRRWNISNWGILCAFVQGERVGGCAIAYDTEGLLMLAGQRDIAVLWDLRVHPVYRRKGIGGRLFAAAIVWAQSRSCRYMNIETQNINVPACRFYARQECILTSIHRFAYPEFPDEVGLIWHRELQS